MTSKSYDFDLQAFFPGFLGDLFQLLGRVVINPRLSTLHTHRRWHITH
jgi:hypothetical protein